jgi:hypothetical protein
LKYFYDVWGSDRTYNHMVVPWTWMFDTPYSWTKQIASHFGGTKQGTAISWPKVIKDKGGIRWQFHHIIDIMPTILEAAGIRAPKIVDGIPQAPIEGVSMAYTFDKANANVPSRHHTQYFEMMGDHALYHDGWIASTKVVRPPWKLVGPVDLNPAGLPWELYDLSKDWTHYDDVAGKYPGSSRNCRTFSGPRRRSTGSAIRRHGCDPARRTAAKSHRRAQRFYLVRGDYGNAEWRRTKHPRRVLQLQSRGGDPGGRRRRDDRDSGRPVRRLWLLLAEGQAGSFGTFLISSGSAGKDRRRCRPANTRSNSTSNTMAWGLARSPSTI